MRSTPCLTLICIAAAALSTTARADDSCNAFKWNVAKEVKLFGGTTQPVDAGKTAAAAPPIRLDTLATLDLTAQSQVSFPVEPGKKMQRDDTYGGLVTFKLPSKGVYHIAVDVPLWIDVVMQGNLVAVQDYQGNKECAAPHKIVEFALAGARPFIIQLSGSTAPVVRLTVTRAAP